MITADSAVTFPLCPTYGFTVDPMILVKIIALESGFERTVRKWRQAKRTYSGVPTGARPQADIESILYFFLAVGATEGTFRFKDWTDYKTCRLGLTPSAIDQPIVSNGESPALYRLSKAYSVGSFTHLRTIYRPIGATVLVANESGVTQSAADWTLDEATGYIVPGIGFVGTPTFWGGEFDVLCRFDGAFQVEMSNFEIQTAHVNLIEKKQA